MLEIGIEAETEIGIETSEGIEIEIGIEIDTDTGGREGKGVNTT